MDPEALWQAYRADPSPGGPAESALLEHYAPLVRMVRGRGFSGVDGSYSLEAADLEQEGALGLLLAIRRYEPGRGRFESFANQYIWGMVQHGLKTADLTPKAAAAQGERWQVISLEDAEGGFWETVPAERVGIGADPAQAVEEAVIETFLSRALRRLTADHRAAFRLACLPGEVPGERGTLTPARIARRLGVSRREVRNLVTETQAVVRYLLTRQGVLSVRQDVAFHSLEKPMKKRRRDGRPAGRRFPLPVQYYADEETREMTRRLAVFEDKSEAAIHRQAIREKYARLLREHPDDPRLSLAP